MKLLSLLRLHLLVLLNDLVAALLQFVSCKNLEVFQLFFVLKQKLWRLVGLAWSHVFLALNCFGC